MNVMLPKTFQKLGCILQKMMEAMNSDSWHPLVSEPSENWHQVFKDALSFLRKKLTEA